MRKALVLVPLVILAGLAAVAAWPKDEPRSLKLWVEKPKTVLALQWKRDAPYLVRADARTLRRQGRVALPLSGHWLGSSFSPDGKLLAVGSDGFGDVWFVDTKRLRLVGTAQAEEYGSVIETAWAGGKLVAVDKAGNRAFVVGAGSPVAEVDLETLAVTYHDLATPVSLPGRLHDWLEPPAETKAPPHRPQRLPRRAGGRH